jgi:predicted nucleic acid-binding protein
MSAKAFLDTNIFVYSEAGQDPAKALIARRLRRSLIDSRDGMISYQVIHEFFNVVLKGPVPKMGPLERMLMLHFVFRKFPSVPNSHDLVERALGIAERYQLPWYDALIIAAALEGGCSILYSEGFQAGQVFDGTLTVVNPFAVHKY